MLHSIRPIRIRWQVARRGFPRFQTIHLGVKRQNTPAAIRAIDSLLCEASQPSAGQLHQGARYSLASDVAFAGIGRRY
jgi:hypothetical protein